MFQTNLEVTPRNWGDDNNGNQTRTYFITDSKIKAPNKNHIFLRHLIDVNAPKWDNIQI